MIAKVKCPKCNEIHDVEWGVNLVNIPEEMAEENDWSQGIFKCVAFKSPYESKEDPEITSTIQDAKRAMRELEWDFLNKINNFEETYGITIQNHLFSNCSFLIAYLLDVTRISRTISSFLQLLSD